MSHAVSLTDAPLDSSDDPAFCANDAVTRSRDDAECDRRRFAGRAARSVPRRCGRCGSRSQARCAMC